MIYPLNGTWDCLLDDGTKAEAVLPGTLDENKIGHADTLDRPWHPNADSFDPVKDVIRTRFTRRFKYEGRAVFSKRLDFTPPENERIFLVAERSRCLSLKIDGKSVPVFADDTLAAPHIFEVTGLLHAGCLISLISDNSYPGLPRDAILNSSAATDETQTNWNGILGNFCLVSRPSDFISWLRVTPGDDLKRLTADVEISSQNGFQGSLSLNSGALEEPAEIRVSAPAGTSRFRFENLAVKPGAKHWDEYEGNLYEMTAVLTPDADDTVPFTKQVSFGLRRIAVNSDHRLTLNGRAFFLRSEANCAVFPETGYEPMDTDTWISVMKTYKSYGVNLVRFHSHIPPEAALTAADKMGMMVEPELNDWDPDHALSDDVSRSYYLRELISVLRLFANHPSFVMLTLGNELATNAAGYANMADLLKAARKFDDSRLYANASNGARERQQTADFNDFHTAMAYKGEHLRGTGSGCPLGGFINNDYPDTRHNYSDIVRKIRRESDQPVYAFEVGQYEVLPDFGEIGEFRGVTEPANFEAVRKDAARRGMLEHWDRYVAATGEIARLAYREEVEAVMRTPEMSGLSLLGLQDFPGQGTALVGMLNSHMQPKPYPFSKSENFRSFFTDFTPLVLMDRRTYTVSDTLEFDLKIANYSRENRTGAPEIRLTLHEETGSVPQPGKMTESHLTGAPVKAAFGRLTDAGHFKIPLAGLSAPARFDLRIDFAGKSASWPVWIYPDSAPVCPENVHVFRTFSDEARKILAGGGIVYLSPASTPETLPGSVRGQFTTDFWSVGTFPDQAGGMGQFIDTSCPLFEKFPTEFHANWQWWPMANRQAVIVPASVHPIVTEMDSFAKLRHMAQIFAGTCLNGRILFSSLGLQDLQQYPEARALQSAIFEYLVSEQFDGNDRIDPEIIENIVSL